jgi:phage terminase large subunit-like protein
MMVTKQVELVQLVESYGIDAAVDDVFEELRRRSGWSLAQIVASLVDEEQAAILSSLNADSLRWDWSFWGRPGQMPPVDRDWGLYAYVAGRGSGKTRAGAEWVHAYALAHPGCRIGLVARRAADVRDVMILGDSGILSVGLPEERAVHYPSRAQIVWPNGSIAQSYSSEEPDQLRGPQFHAAWADEVAAWKHTVDASGLNAWDNLSIATRLGDNPQIFATTTPKRTGFMFELLEREKTDPEVVVSRGSTFDNAGNLSKAYMKRMNDLYQGTRLAEQELYGQMLEQVEGALWDDNFARVNTAPGGLLKVIAVDPSVSENPRDECGIVVVGATPGRVISRTAYVLEDATVWGAPSVWAEAVVEQWKKHRCPVIVEVNQGGAMARTIINNIEPEVPVFEVRAYEGKHVRAEPVTLKYDKGLVKHVGVLAELEAQLTSWVPGERGSRSPDRLDALVYAITALLVKPPKGSGLGGGGRMRVSSAAHRKIGESRVLGR